MISVAAIPSMSGILISIKRTSGFTSLDISIASRPVRATPTTSTSGSNCSNFLMLSLVSAMSSTITTLILSVSTTYQLQGSNLFIVAGMEWHHSAVIVEPMQSLQVENRRVILQEWVYYIDLTNRTGLQLLWYSNPYP